MPGAQKGGFLGPDLLDYPPTWDSRPRGFARPVLHKLSVTNKSSTNVPIESDVPSKVSLVHSPVGPVRVRFLAAGHEQTSIGIQRMFKGSKPREIQSDLPECSSESSCKYVGPSLLLILMLCMSCISPSKNRRTSDVMSKVGSRARKELRRSTNKLVKRAREEAKMMGPKQVLNI